MMLLRLASNAVRSLRRHAPKPLTLSVLQSVQRVRPYDLRLLRFTAETLLVEPVTANQLARASQLARCVLSEIPDDPNSLKLLRRAALASARRQPGSAATVDLLCAAAAAHPERQLHLLEHDIRKLDRIGNRDEIVSAVGVLLARLEVAALSMALRVSLWADDLDSAEACLDKIREHPDASPEYLADAQARVLLAGHKELDAIEVLESLRPQRGGTYSNQLIQALREIGDASAIVRYLRITHHGLPANTAALYEFNALWDLGDIDAAVGLIGEYFGNQIEDLRFIQALLAAAEYAGWTRDDLLDLWRRAEAQHLLEGEMEGPTALRFSAAYSALDTPEDVIRFTGTVEQPTDAIRMHRARALYATRRLTAAVQELEAMTDDPPRWDAIKLRSRIAFEFGSFDEALRLRAVYPDPPGTHDEAKYHALLQLGRHEEAFVGHESVDGRRRLRATYGMSADADIAATVSKRVVFQEGGPGDEVILAATYGALSKRSQSLVVSCDPRLESLLARSFPEVQFIPVERLRGLPRPGKLGPSADLRPRCPMFRLATQRLHEAALDADSVVIGSRLPVVTLWPQWRAEDAYLEADEQLIAAVARDRGHGGLGVVWRSELRSQARDIHYLTVEELAPIVPLHGTIVCLQHDATKAERDALVHLTDGAVEFLDDIDLRNDFETTAALLSTLDSVVGVGTTMVELAASLGTPTVMMQPTHFGTWRATGDERIDYWHTSVTLAHAEPPWDKSQLVEDAAHRLVKVQASTSPFRPAEEG